jgi:hypothetical protein
MYICISGKHDISDDGAWLANMDASLQDGIWEIGERVPNGYAGGGLSMFLSASDGQLINYHSTQ